MKNKTKILIVDDSSVNREKILELIRQHYGDCEEVIDNHFEKKNLKMEIKNMEKKIYTTYIHAFGDANNLQYDELNTGKSSLVELDKIEKIEYDRPIFTITLK